MKIRFSIASLFTTTATVACVLATLSALAQSKTTFGSDNAAICYRESNLPTSALGLKYCTQAIRNDQLTMRDLAATHTNRGIIHAANGSLGKAMRDHNEAASLMPDMGKIYVNRGNVFHQQQQYDKALEDYQRALEMKGVPLDVVHYNRALSFISLKQLDRARNALKIALFINPESTRAKKKLAQLDALLNESGRQPGSGD